jgi:hypothetical protein
VSADDEFDRTKVIEFKIKDNAYGLFKFPADVLVNDLGRHDRRSAGRHRRSIPGLNEAPEVSRQRVPIGDVSTLSDRPDASTERWRRRAHTMAYVNLTYVRLPRPIRVVVSLGLMWAAHWLGFRLPSCLGGL